MKTLLVMRHAKSLPRYGVADHDRPLNGRGRRDASRMGAALRAEGLVPDVVLASSAERAQETAVVAAVKAGVDGAVRVEPGLYEGEPQAYLDAVRRHGAGEVVLVVGHNPSVELVVEHLTDHHQAMSTGAVARVALPIDAWAELGPYTQGAFLGLWRPREVPRL